MPRIIVKQRVAQDIYLSHAPAFNLTLSKSILLRNKMKVASASNLLSQIVFHIWNESNCTSSVIMTNTCRKNVKRIPDCSQ